MITFPVRLSLIRCRLLNVSCFLICLALLSACNSESASTEQKTHQEKLEELRRDAGGFGNRSADEYQQSYEQEDYVPAAQEPEQDNYAGMASEAAADSPSKVIASWKRQLPFRGSISQYYLLSTYELQPGDLNGFSKQDMRLLRNAIYALHNYKFNSEDLQQFFGGFHDYKGINQAAPNFNEIEKANIYFIKRYE